MENNSARAVLFQLLQNESYKLGESTKKLKGLLKDYQIPSKQVNMIITIANTYSFQEFAESYKKTSAEEESNVLKNTLKIQILEEYPFDEIALIETIHTWAHALNANLPVLDYASLKEQAEQGNAYAQYEIAKLLDSEKNYEKAAEWYMESAIGLYTKAQLALGICYEEGRGLPQDYLSAFKWYLRAANKMNMEAKLRIGKLYYKGLGTERNVIEAYHHLLEAADADLKEAAYYVACMTENGQGTKKDEAIAARWYKKAAQMGCGKAQKRLSELYEQGLGVAADLKKAAYWGERSERK